MSPLLMAWQGKIGCQKLSDSSGGMVRKHLYESNAGRRNFAETINIVQQLFPYLKPMLAGPWQLVTTWKSLHPSQLHRPLPFPLLQAMVSVAASWPWIRAALMLLLGFFGLLRPVEACSLKVEDCIRSTETKSRTRGARHQSVRVDEAFVRAFLDKCWATMRPKERMWPHTARLFRTRFAQLLERACGQSRLCLPSSLRPGGATYFCRRWNEDIPRLRW